MDELTLAKTSSLAVGVGVTVADRETETLTPGVGAGVTAADRETETPTPTVGVGVGPTVEAETDAETGDTCA